MIFTFIEVVPLTFILYTLFKELGTIDKIVSICQKKKPADTGATTERQPSFSEDPEDNLFDKSQCV